MVNIFKKISHGASNMFKKVDKGASNAFKKVGSGVTHAINTVHDGIDTGLKGAKGVLRQVGNGLEKYSPLIEAGAAAFAPEFAIPIAAGLETAKAFTNNSRQMIKAGQGMNNKLAETMHNKSNTVLSGAQQKFGNVSSGLSGLVQNKIGQAQGYANQGQALYNQGQGLLNQGQGLANQAHNLFKQGPGGSGGFKSQLHGLANQGMQQLGAHMQNQLQNMAQQNVSIH